MSDETTALSLREMNITTAPMEVVGPFENWMNAEKFNHIQRIAKVFSTSDLVPVQYRNKESDCIIGVQMAFRLNVDPFMFLQNTHVIQGRPGMEAKLVIALVNNRGPFSGPIQWRFDGEKGNPDWRCTAYAVHRNTGELCEATVTWQMVTDEGWSGKSGSKWKTMPEIMFRYRSAAFLARLYCPEVLMGMMTVEETEDLATTTVVAPLFPERTVKKIDSTPLEIEVEPVDESKPEKEEKPVVSHETKLDQLIKLITGKEQAVLDYLIGIKWLKPEQGFEDLADAHLDVILKKPVPFLAAVEKGADNE